MNRREDVDLFSRRLKASGYMSPQASLDKQADAIVKAEWSLSLVHRAPA